MRGGQQWLRVLFFGTDSFALPTLRTLVEDLGSVHTTRIIDHVQVACPPRGRPTTLSSSSPSKRDDSHVVRDFCEANHIFVHDCPPRDNDWEGFVASLAPQFDVGVVASFGHIIPDVMLDHFRLGALNVHPSLLPKYRGAAPLHHTILNGDSTAGVSIIEVSKRTVDVGRVLLQESFSVDQRWYLEDLRDHAAELGAQMMLRVLGDLSSYQDNARPQQDLPYPSSYAGKRFKKHTVVDWGSMTRAAVVNMHRCYANNLGLHSTVAGRPVTIAKLADTAEAAPPIHVPSPSPSSSSPSSSSSSSSEASERADVAAGVGVPSPGAKLLHVRCKDGFVPITHVQFPTRRPITIKQLYHQLGVPRTQYLQFGPTGA
ncbi:hypothetical protein PTSG_01345 [Salpingoeca rosetta]|uniref:methionyl-tRNA formyltransferase n=1 Tax=Salpingoeca rosetta (strain ATCC 50818 / BSB-021) TaxID=946362 RepID=F2U028_SALR5|nr:uncharacterized protein PTSG_01345 [Salpingoeca rosetta]EGD80756.1 hypothetical protein PTSG_01345 [Salpingoeca rosetta]|eukprot:XP_004997317.1 hypothetical protein PTSG_01345 [Salpingoeca rosetta]